jgi:hypothetical protein
MTNELPQYTVSDIPNLEHRLSILAMTWRGEPKNRKEIKREYHETISILYSLGWDDILDVDCELPEEDMPPEYKRRHPYTKTDQLGRFSWSKNKS